MHIREAIEVTIAIAFATLILWLHRTYGTPIEAKLIWAVVIFAAFKTAYYFGESLWHLVQAAASDLAYHRFLLLMAYNMAEVTLSFALDFFCLQRLDPGSFTGLDATLGNAELLFNCFYFSVLNFSFFGYGDIIPAHIPAKIVMLLEVITAFSTVIFIISDFVSMKDSMRRSQTRGSSTPESSVSE
jgi:hypothetical protein